MSAASRRDVLRATAAERGLDAVLVTNLLNVRYLTGFTGSNGALLVRTDGADLFGTDRSSLESIDANRATASNKRCHGGARRSRPPRRAWGARRRRRPRRPGCRGSDRRGSRSAARRSDCADWRL